MRSSQVTLNDGESSRASAAKSPSWAPDSVIVRVSAVGSDEDHAHGFDGVDDDGGGGEEEVVDRGSDAPLMNAQDAKLAFKDLTVTVGGQAPLKGAIGYIRKGGLTAVLGPSASGKSVLLEALAGHSIALAGAEVFGSVFLDGKKMIHGARDTQVALVPQSNVHLVGVLTVRECFEYSLQLKRPRMSAAERKQRVDETLSALGLDVAQNTQIGTIYKRGISGGQQRRVAVGMELVYGPSVTLLDEPTSGLDTTTALKTVRYLRAFLAKSGGTSGMMLTIHQPNDELLSLFDDVVMLTGGGCIYSGVVAGARPYLTAITGSDARWTPGVPVSETFLRLADRTFPKRGDDGATRNFPALFSQSNEYASIASLVKAYTASESSASSGSQPSSFGDHITKFFVLSRRLVTVAKRDLTLYHVQYVLQGNYGLMMGALFFQREYVLGSGANEMLNSCLWLAALVMYVFVFKSYYNAIDFTKLTHESENNMYGPITNALSELSVLLMAVPGYIPAVAICYFMIGFPASSFGFMIALVFVATFAGEAIPTLVAQFTKDDASKALMVTQGLLLIFFIFAGGTFIREEKVPDYWVWVQKISIFEHGVKAVTTNAFSEMELGCPAPYSEGGAEFGYQPTVMTEGYGSCATIDAVLPCDALDTGALTSEGCKVKGLTVVRLVKQYDMDKWTSLLYLFLVGLAFRVFAILFRMFPPAEMVGRVKTWLSSGANRKARDAHLTDWFAPIDVALTTKTSTKAIAPSSSNRKGTQDGPDLLSFRNVGVHIVKKLLTKPKTIVEDISGVVKGGRLCALMGPSGSGKTTLLNALSGRALYAEIEGTILLNGSKLTKKHFAYVPQIDTINPNFTVQETLSYTARLRTAEMRDGNSSTTRVIELMEIVGLVPLADVRTSKLTGGQLKLLSVAMGLVQAPTVLFLDEPTTGLDSTSASAVMEYLSVIARTGVVTLLTVHQPSKSVFDLVDDVLLLGSGGSLEFSGSKADAIAYFSAPPLSLSFPEDANPADILIDAVSTSSRDGAVDKTATSSDKAGGDITGTQPRASERSSVLFQQSEYNTLLSEKLLMQESDKTTNGSDNTIPSPSFVTRISVLVDKMTRFYIREPGAYLYMAIVVFLFSIFLGTLFYDIPHTTSDLREVLAAMFLAIWMSLYFSLVSIPINCMSRNEAVQMVASNHCTQFEWCLAEFIAQLPFSFGVSMMLSVSFHFMTRINPEFDAFVFMALNLWLLHMTFAAVSWNLIEVLVNPMLVTTAAMAVLGTFFLFAGFFITQSNMVPLLGWIPYTVATFYSLSGTEYAYFHGVNYTDVRPDGSEVMITGESILDTQFDLRYDNEARHWFDLLIVAAFLLMFRAQHLQLFWRHTKDLGVTIRHKRPCYDKDCCRDLCGC